MAEQLRGVIRAAQSEKRLPSVSAAAVRDGEIVWAEAVGLADVEAGEEATPDHQYRVASITKTFTAVAVMQLRDAGALSLDDPLDRHIAGAAHTPSLRTLLSHLSGLQRELPGRTWETLTFPTREELVAGLADAEQVLPTEQWWHYSNLAFALLGEVVARVSGREYRDYVDGRILRPLGLERTTWMPVEPAARGYFVEPFADAVRLEPAVDGQAAAAAGELWSTSLDLCRWAAFLTAPDAAVLAPETVDEMRAFRGMADPETWTLGYGLGLQLYRRGERVFAGHSGAHLGYLSNVACHPETKTGACVLTNASAGVQIAELGIDLADTVASLYPAEPDQWRPGAPPPPELAGVLGSWWSEGHEYAFRFRGGALEAVQADARPGAALTRFRPDGPDRYRAISGTERGEALEVVRDDGGAVVRLYFASYPFTRTPEPLAPAN